MGIWSGRSKQKNGGGGAEEMENEVGGKMTGRENGWKEKKEEEIGEGRVEI